MILVIYCQIRDIRFWVESYTPTDNAISGANEI